MAGGSVTVSSVVVGIIVLVAAVGVLAAGAVVGVGVEVVTVLSLFTFSSTSSPSPVTVSVDVASASSSVVVPTDTDVASVDKGLVDGTVVESAVVDVPGTSAGKVEASTSLSLIDTREGVGDIGLVGDAVVTGFGPSVVRGLPFCSVVVLVFRITFVTVGKTPPPEGDLVARLLSTLLGGVVGLKLLEKVAGLLVVAAVVTEGMISLVNTLDAVDVL